MLLRNVWAVAVLLLSCLWSTSGPADVFDAVSYEKSLDELNKAIKAGGSPSEQVSLHSRRGDALFFLGRFAEAVADYEKMVALEPSLDRSHWRRGIAYFYAGRFADAAHQFEIYHVFDNVDRENGIWRYFSQVRAHGPKGGGKGLLKYEKDDREPFGDVYRMFARTMTGKQVLERIAGAKVDEAEREKRLFYAELYVGLNEAIENRPRKALAHLNRAVANRWPAKAGFGPHYMWQVGRLHRDLLLDPVKRIDALGQIEFEIELMSPLKGFDGKSCWVHARGGTIPASALGDSAVAPIVVVTMQKLLLTRYDVFFGLHDMRTEDLGKTWSGPTEHVSLRRRQMGSGEGGRRIEAVPCDFTPSWHSRSGKLLGTGKTFWYDANRQDHVPHAPSEPVYAVYDVASKSWGKWKTVALPDEPRFKNTSAGCTQRVDLPNGDILLPVYFRKIDEKIDSVTVLLCTFDGKEMRYVRHGEPLTVADTRGLSEPSLVHFGGRYYLTIRHDARAYVTTSEDGLRYEALREWRFDDRAVLGSYNTQQHWAAHGNGLFLIYTRRGADNDHVFRHRAPLFIGRVDPERLVVIRSSERVVVPERGTRIGNFGVFDVGADETWVSVTEWMQPKGVTKYGSDNSLFVAKIRWQ